MMKAFRAGFAASLYFAGRCAGRGADRHRMSSAGWFSRGPIARNAIPSTGSAPSPLSIAPPFRDLHKRYPVESLEEAFAEGISTGHPTMPQFRFEPDQIGNLIAFLK